MFQNIKEKILKYVFNISAQPVLFNELMVANRLFNEQFFKESIIKLFDKIDKHKSHYIIQINITLGNFEESKTMTMNLLNYEEDIKQAKLTDSLQKLRNKFGIDIIKSAGEL